MACTLPHRLRIAAPRSRPIRCRVSPWRAPDLEGGVSKVVVTAAGAIEVLD